MTKVVMISSPVHTIPPRKGAAVEWWMLQVAQKLTNLDMHIIAIRGEDEPATEISDNITFHRIRIGKLYKRFFQKLTRLDPWSYSRRANFIINSIKPDIVHIHNNISLYKELITLNRDKNRKYILHMHNEKKPTDLPDFCNLFVVSAYLENWYRNRLPDANIQVIANGVDTDVFQPKWLDKETSVVKEINSAAISGKKVIMYVGRMSPEKGPLKLARAFGELLKQRKDLFLLLVGEFSTGEGDRAKYSQAIRAQCALYAEHCQLIDVIPPDHIHHFYRLADMLVIPSDFEEPFGMVCIEAMASGVPVLAARRGGLMKIVNEPDYGYHIREPDNPKLFAKQISELIDKKDELQSIAKKAHLYVKKLYDWRNVAHQTENAYYNLNKSSGQIDDRVEYNLVDKVY